jgi:DNA-binding transcriptional MerR regulator
MMTVNEVAKLTGVSVRTLQYYDKIDLLKPAENTISGYRLYNTDNLLTLQQILFYKELGFTLKDIKSALNAPFSDNKTRLLEQQSLLIQKKRQIEKMIVQVNSLIKGEKKMDFEVFKKVVATKILKDTNEEIKEKILDKFTPEIYETIESSWGAKGFLEMPQRTADEVQTYITEGKELLDKLLNEPNQDIVVELLKKWMKLTLSFANLTNKETFVSLMKKGYRDNAQVIQATDDAYGSGASKKLAHLLEKYHEELISND